MEPLDMSARRLLNVLETMIVDRAGREALDEYLAPGAPVDDLAARRRDNVLATLALGGEVA